MDWGRARFDWNRVRAFLATAELGSVTAAARALGAAQPTLSRQVAALEHELRVRLFEREGRGLQLTDAGLRLLEPTRRMAEAAAEVAAATTGEPRAVTGHVAVRVSALLGAYVVLPVVERLQEQHPGVLVSFMSCEHVSTLPWHAVDIELTGTAPMEDGLRSERLRDAELGLYAADGLARKLKAVSAWDLIDVPLLGFNADARLRGELVRRGFKLSRAWALQAEEPLLSWHLLLSGRGVALLDQSVGEAEGKLTRVLPGLTLREPRWLVGSASALARPAVSGVFDALLTALA